MSDTKGWDPFVSIRKGPTPSYHDENRPLIKGGAYA